MKRLKRKIGITLGCCALAGATFYISDNVFADNEENYILQGESYSDMTNLMMSVDKEGNVTYVEVEDHDMSEELSVAEDATYDVYVEYGNNEREMVASFETYTEANAFVTRRQMMRSINEYTIYSEDQLRSVTYGVVNFATKSVSQNTYFTEDGTGVQGYLNGSYAPDAAYLGTSSDGTLVKFKIAGVTGWVSVNDVQILNYDDIESISFYRCEQGRIYHYLTTDLSQSYYCATYDVGPQQSYMESDTVYYSYDGHYFYTSYEQMIDDYKNGVFANAINPSTPYYNYYQYLSHRSKTTYTAADFDAYVDAVVGSYASALKSQGDAFITAQNTFGANALLVFGLAVNESGWGQSYYALNQNNIFGHNAVDSSPDLAYGYSSVAESISQHAQYYVSEGYLDPKDAFGRYHGSHLGDKASGMNVSYASDPYWGEKAASQGYYMERKLSKSDDYGTYQIGIKTTHTNVTIYSEANTSSAKLYETGVWQDYPFIILDTVTGSSVNGNTTWYKIQSDSTLNSSRTAITQDQGEYDYENYYGYVNASYIDVIAYEGKADDATDDAKPAAPVTPSEETPSTPSEETPQTPSYMKGDVNGDGKITPADYVKVKNHIMGKSILSGTALQAADVNEDGKITPADYVKIKNHIMGVSKIS